MITYETFMEPSKLNVSPITDKLKLIRRRVYFATQSLDAGNGDVHRLIPVIAGDVVLAAWVDVDTACPEFATIDLGYGTVVNYWGNGLRIDAAGPVKTVLSATKTINFADLLSGRMETTEVEIEGAAYDDQVIVTPSIFTQDLILAGCVSDTRFDRVTVQLLNQSGEIMDLGSMTLNVVVNKAPLAGQPLVFGAADTIDIKATTDARDVNISSGVIDVYAMILRP